MVSINFTIFYNIKKQYALIIYREDSVDEIHDSEIQFTINDQLFLETLLMEIRGKTISFASYLRKNNNDKEKKIN